MEDREKYLRLKTKVIHIVLLLMTLLFVAISSAFYTHSAIHIIRNSVIAVISVGTVIFLLLQANIKHSFADDNEMHPLRFGICFILALLLGVLVPLLPVSAWPYVTVFITLTLFSNTLIGIVSASFVLMISVLLSSTADVNTFCLYFISGVVCSILFEKLDSSFKIGYPFFLSIMIMILCEIANVILFTNETLHMELFIIPLVNVIVSSILILIILKLYGNFVIFKYREKYLNINDTEFPLLVELKEKQPDAYFHAIHVAYLSDKIVGKLQLNSQYVKTMAYYQKIGILLGEANMENTLKVMEEYEFPPDIYEYLSDVIENSLCPRTKEAYAVLMAEMIISSMEFLYAKNPQKEIVYEQVILALFKKKIESTFPQKCGLTYSEAELTKNVLLEEKLYYDFLHR